MAVMNSRGLTCFSGWRWQSRHHSICSEFRSEFLHQPPSHLLLTAGRLVSHGGNELARPYVLFRMAVAIQAPLHLQRVLLPGERHPVHPPVTALTADSLVDVDAVIDRKSVV